MSQQIARYDYAGLDAATADYLRSAAQRIHGHMRRTVEDAAAIGAELIAAKERLPHGAFQAWVQNVVGMDYATARNLMNTAVLCRQNAQYSTFTPTVVYELAAPGTPEDVRRAVLAGEVAPTVKAVKEAKRQASGQASGRVVPSAPNGAYHAPLAASRAPMDERMYDLLFADEGEQLDADTLLDALAWRLADRNERADMSAARNAAELIGHFYIEAAEIAAKMSPIHDD